MKVLEGVAMELEDCAFPTLCGVEIGDGANHIFDGALLALVLIVAVLRLIVSAIIWAIATIHGNYATASKGRIGVLVAIGAAVLARGSVAGMNWLLNLGQTL